MITGCGSVQQTFRQAAAGADPGLPSAPRLAGHGLAALGVAVGVPRAAASAAGGFFIAFPDYLCWSVLAILGKSFMSFEISENLENLRNFRKISDLFVKFSKRPNFVMNYFEKKCRTCYVDAKSSYKSIAHS